MGSVCCTGGGHCKLAEAPSPRLEVTKVEPESAVEPKLAITIVGARGLRSSKWLPGEWGKPDSYCVVKSGDRTLFTTEVLSNVLEPVWNETTTVDDHPAGEPLQFSVHDSDGVLSDCLGKAALASEQLASGFNGELQLAEAGQGIEAFLRLKVKVAGMSLPRGPQAQIELTVEKGDSSLWGLDFDVEDDQTLRVAQVNPGPFADYNDTVKPELQVIPSDFIKAANGVAGPGEKLLEQFRTGSKLTLLVRREVRATFILAREAKAALGVEFLLGARSLAITKIFDGLFKDFNSKAEEEHMKIQVGDRIVAVAGFQGTGASIQRKLMNITGKFQLVLSRPAPTNHWYFWP